MKFIFSCILTALCLSSHCQDAETENPDSDKQFLNDLKVGFNVVRTANTFIGSGRTSHEATITADLGKFDLTADYGLDQRQRSGATYEYESDGTYFRAGVDRNFITNEKSGNVLSMGLRYARASYNDRLNSGLDSTAFGSQNFQLSNDPLTARWMELVLNMRGKVASNLYMGFTLRWKFARLINGEDGLMSFDVPGFGTTRRENATAFDYYLMWRIPFIKE